MSAQQDAMTAAVGACEAAIEQLVQARTDYETAYRAVAHCVHASAGLRAAADLDHVVGPHRLSGNIATRLVTLGFTLAAGPIGPEWSQWLAAAITSHVP